MQPNNKNPLFYLEKPSFNKSSYSNLSAVLKNDPSYIKQIMAIANGPKYVYWDKFKHKAIPGELSIEEQWLLVSTYRDASSTATPIKSSNGKHFKWVRLPYIDEKLHEIDMLTGGGIFPQSKVPIGDREVYISRGVIEESIASSQLEGAHTTRAAAKEMILAKRKPKNRSEQMIVNNYQAMMALENDFKNRALSREMLLELHSIITDKTMDADEQKRFRRDSDHIVVQGIIGAQEYTTHIPPNETFLQKEIDRLIAYANDELEDRFIHPVVKAISIHFWIGYLHPFTDGNGRLARALFYWYLLKKGYWTIAYIPISTVIKKSPVQYAMAYIYSEQDQADLTYFFDYKMRKIIQAIQEFNLYIEKQINQNRTIEDIIDNDAVINDRQKQLLFYLLSERNGSTTASSHSIVNHISRQTGTKDLKSLERLGLIKPRREGKYTRYYASEGLVKLAELKK